MINMGFIKHEMLRSGSLKLTLSPSVSKYLEVENTESGHLNEVFDKLKALGLNLFREVFPLEDGGAVIYVSKLHGG